VRQQAVSPATPFEGL